MSLTQIINNQHDKLNCVKTVNQMETCLKVKEAKFFLQKQSQIFVTQIFLYSDLQVQLYISTIMMPEV
jgi:chorismate-pyruvate lyase